MDNVARDSRLTTPDRADRARGAWALYASTFDGSILPDLIADLLHLASVDEVSGGAACVLDAAVDIFNAELTTWPTGEPTPSGAYRAEVSIPGREWMVAADGDEPREVARELVRHMQLVGFYHSEMAGHIDDLIAGHVLTSDCGTAFRVSKAADAQS